MTVVISALSLAKPVWNLWMANLQSISNGYKICLDAAGTVEEATEAHEYYEDADAKVATVLIQSTAAEGKKQLNV